MKLKEVTLTVSKYGVTVAISSYFFVFVVVVSHLGTYAADRKVASLPLGLSLVRERCVREEPS